MAISLAALTLPLTLSGRNELTIWRAERNRSFDFSRDQLNFLPGCRTKINRNTKAHLKSNVHVDLPKIADPTTERLLENGLVFQQKFTVRSYEIGSDSKMSIETLMNYLQDSSLNHWKWVGLQTEGFGSTPDMSAKGLIWVVCWSHIEVDCYPSWSDVVQVNTWIYKSRKSGVNRGWHVRDFKTGKTLIQATSFYVMMNKKTRKYAKLSEECMKPFLKHCDHLMNMDRRKLPQLDTDKADYARTGLNSLWTDVDINQHVNNVKLVNYALESVPLFVAESHKLSAITLEYKKECRRDYVLQSFSRFIQNKDNGSSSIHSMDKGEIGFDHLLCTECGQEIVRARTTWKPKKPDNSRLEVHI